MIDYKIDVNLVNSLPLVSGAKGPARVGRGQNNANQEAGQANSESARYIGNWVEKGEDYFIIYLAFATHDVAGEGDGGIFASVPQEPYVPAHILTDEREQTILLQPAKEGEKDLVALLFLLMTF